MALDLPRRLRRRRAAIGWIAMAAVLGLALRLGFSVGYWVDKPLTHDEVEYLTLARSLATGQGFAYPPPAPDEPAAERFGRAPLYPFVLSVIGRSAVLDTPPASVPVTIKIGQSLIGTLAVLVLAAVAWHAAGPAAGALAATLAAVHPPLVWISAYALSEVLFVPLAWLAVWLFDRSAVSHAPARASAALALAAGVVSGLSALARPGMLVFLAIAAAWLLARRPARLLFAVMAGAAIVVLPWTARMTLEHGRPIVIASEGGITFWTGNHPLAIGEGDMAANPGISRANNALRQAHPGLSPEEFEAVYYREAIGHILDHPAWWAGLLIRKLFYLVVPIGPSYTLHSPLYQLGSIVPYLLLLPLAVAGAWRLWRTAAPVPGLWLMLASAVVSALVFFPQERFRIPTIDPGLIVCAAAWIAWRFGGRGAAGGADA